MSVREEFWSIVCRYAQYYYLLLVLLTVLVLLDLLALALGPPDHGTFVISVVVLGILGVTILGVIGVLWQCQRT